MTQAPAAATAMEGPHYTCQAVGKAPGVLASVISEGFVPAHLTAENLLRLVLPLISGHQYGLI